MRILSSAATAALVILPASLDAQLAWESPRLMAPSSPGGVGFYWLHSSSLGPSADAGMATLALPGVGRAITLRGGAAVDEADDVSAFGGIDLKAPITRHTSEQPLDLDWTTGIGAAGRLEGGKHVVVTLPMGINAGRSWSSGSVWLAPYLLVGAAVDVHFGADAPDDEFELSPAVDVGLDFSLDAARHFIIRVATSLGDRQALVLGLNVGG